MATKTTSPSGRGSRHDKRHTKTVTRWAKRKKAEKADAQDRQIDDIAMAGSRRNLFFQSCHKEKVKSDAQKREREMLATTSLKDLIK